MSVHNQAFVIRISKGGSSPFWYAWSDQRQTASYMTCLANAKMYIERAVAEETADKLRSTGHHVEIVTVTAEGA